MISTASLRLLPLLGLGLILSGCIGTRLNPEAQQVKIMYQDSDVKGKRYVGDAMGYCGSWWNSFFLSWDYQYENSTNMLKNAAAAQRGSCVLIRDQIPASTAVIFFGTIYADP